MLWFGFFLSSGGGVDQHESLFLIARDNRVYELFLLIQLQVQVGTVDTYV